MAVADLSHQPQWVTGPRVRLSRAGTQWPDAGWRQLARIGGGTGVIGGYTTYSAFALEATQLIRADQIAIGTAYALTSVVLGIACAWVGATLAQHIVQPATDEGDAE